MLNLVICSSISQYAQYIIHIMLMSISMIQPFLYVYINNQLREQVIRSGGTSFVLSFWFKRVGLGRQYDNSLSHFCPSVDCSCEDCDIVQADLEETRGHRSWCFNNNRRRLVYLQIHKKKIPCMAFYFFQIFSYEQPRLWTLFSWEAVKGLSKLKSTPSENDEV